MAKKNKKNSVVNTEESKEEVKDTIETISQESSPETSEGVREETLTAKELDMISYSENETISEPIDTSEGYIPQEDITSEQSKEEGSLEEDTVPIENEPLVFNSESVEEPKQEIVKESTNDNLSVLLNGYPVAKSFVLDQMANNPTIRILEVRPNAYISVKTGSK